MVYNYCPTCNQEIRANNFKRHVAVCVWPKPKKKIRGIDFDPNSGYKDGSRQIWNKGLVKEDHDSLKQMAKSISNNKIGKIPSQLLTESARINLSKSISKRLIVDYASGKRKVLGGKIRKYSYSDLKVQGTYELRACKILDKLKELGKIIDWSYSTTRIKYFSKIHQRERTYIVDFTIIQNDGISLLEVKGRVRDEDFEKWEAARKLFPFEVWYNRDLLKNEFQLGL